MSQKEKKECRVVRRCTIYDVAKQAQVSPSTVSHVLNGTASISPSTQKCVLEAVEKLGYRPNANARALRQPHSRILGVIFPDISSEYYASCTASIIQQARRQNYVVLANDLHFDNDVLKFSIPALVERRVDGLIFVGGTQDEVYLKMVTEAGVPLVLGDRMVEGYPCVEFNNYETMRKLVGALYDSGYRRFGYVGEAINQQHNLERRFSGFLAGIKERSISSDNVFVQLDESLNFSEKINSAYAFFRGYFAQTDREHMPQVMLTSNDMVAMGCMSAALRSGFRVPEDIAIIGFDNISLAAFSTPSITSIEQNPYRLGVSCFSELMAQMQGKETHNIMLSQQVVVRRSAPISEDCLIKNGLDIVRDSR